MEDLSTATKEKTAKNCKRNESSNGKKLTFFQRNLMDRWSYVFQILFDLNEVDTTIFSCLNSNVLSEVLMIKNLGNNFCWRCDYELISSIKLSHKSFSINGKLFTS